jgi:hypothetical protein
MQDKLTKIFQRAKYESAPGLASYIWRKLLIRNKHIAQFKLSVYAVVTLISFGGLVPAFKTLAADFTQSGFYEYFSLIFSSSGSIFYYWKELVFSLAESLPVMSIVLTLSLVFICFFSLRHFMKQIDKRQLLSI